jgi:hypothetical protein
LSAVCRGEAAGESQAWACWGGLRSQAAARLHACLLTQPPRSAHTACAPPAACAAAAAANYRNGRAEAAIGRALSLLLVGNTGQEFPESRLEVARDALFISSKAGYLTPGVQGCAC